MPETNSLKPLSRFPSWLRRSVRFNKEIIETKTLLFEKNINTVCQSARCPNIHDCFSRKKCTFLILGNYCTRSCRFCAIETEKKLSPPDTKELFDIRDAVRDLGVRSVVITSVTRDDLEDGGAGHFADCIKILREAEILQPGVYPERSRRGLQDDQMGETTESSQSGHLNIEVLVPDFLGRKSSIERVVFARPDVFAHNIETVPRLYKEVRPQADYKRSLDVIRHAKGLSAEIVTKSGLMAGLGEDVDEVYGVMRDLKRAGCDIITIGQYLKPDTGCLDVKEFLHPSKFEQFSEWAKEIGFKKYNCSPFTRSSYLE
ncbi:MAG: radical SAM protein [Candidatus Omnitrophica bacterium]|nr:radical SAM protein [Candidatus Omnitrophota bacterium]